jgi:hypothetical protein
MLRAFAVADAGGTARTCTPSREGDSKTAGVRASVGGIQKAIPLTSSPTEGTCAVRRLRGLVPHEPALLEIAADVRVVQP